MFLFYFFKSTLVLGRMAGPHWDLGAGVLGLLSQKLSGVRGGVYGPLMLTSEDEANRDTRAISANPPKGRFPGSSPYPLPMPTRSVPRSTLSIAAAKGACPEGS